VILAGVLWWGINNLLGIMGGVQLVTTPASVLPDILRFAALRPGEHFVELGAGLGSVAGAVARENSKCTIFGIDVAPLWIWLARWRQAGSGAQYFVANAYTYSYKTIDVLYCYLRPPMLARLEDTFVRELKPGSRLISYGFPLPSKKPIAQIERSVHRGPLYLYVF